jgi:hypothetical protein
VAEKASWDPANRRQKLGLVWKTKRKLAKFLMNTFTYRSSSYLFYGKFAKSKNKRNASLSFSLTFLILFDFFQFVRGLGGNRLFPRGSHSPQLSSLSLLRGFPIILFLLLQKFTSFSIYLLFIV